MPLDNFAEYSYSYATPAHTEFSLCSIHVEFQPMATQRQIHTLMSIWLYESTSHSSRRFSLDLEQGTSSGRKFFTAALEVSWMLFVGSGREDWLFGLRTGTRDELCALFLRFGRRFPECTSWDCSRHRCSWGNCSATSCMLRSMTGCRRHRGSAPAAVGSLCPCSSEPSWTTAATVGTITNRQIRL